MKGRELMSQKEPWYRSEAALVRDGGGIWLTRGEAQRQGAGVGALLSPVGLLFTCPTLPDLPLATAEELT